MRRCDALLFARNHVLGSVQFSLVCNRWSVPTIRIKFPSKIELKVRIYQMVSELQWSQCRDEDQVDKVWRDLGAGRRWGHHGVLHGRICMGDEVG